MITIELLESALNEYQSSVTRLRQYIHASEKECRKLIEVISKKNFIQCDEDFHRLEKFQEIFSNITYKGNFPVSQEIKDFVYFFDRLDDIDIKKYWYEKFRDGTEWPSES
ncbi:hypothetical protein VSX61_11155 [Brenneria populi subsp. brevivirga]|uniref:hypothetical protein n=1 Tax=Brenneria populi TaxID=1505588 RepID=UPI002E19BF15|nr:hypothetical protein [Brenneria populi subsp. brevivirga]